jgi:large subunit ribosomal protein L27
VIKHNNSGSGPLGSIRFATKKAGGSSKNGRDSKPKFLGVKISGGGYARSGSIILKQRGKKYRPSGDNTVGIGRDHTLYAKIDGTVVFALKNQKQYVRVLPGVIS